MDAMSSQPWTGDVGPEASSPTDRFNMELEYLDQLCHRLEERLGFILLAGGNEANNSPKAAPQSGYEGHIDRLRELRYRLQSILDRVHL